MGLDENLVFKKGKNYRLVIITLIHAKMMRQLILDSILGDVKDKEVLGSSLHGYMKGKLCLTHLIAFFNKMTDLVDGSRVVIVVYLDLLRFLTLFPTTSKLTN